MEQRTQLYPGVWLRTVESHKFKTGCLSLNMIRPLTEQTASANALIPCLPLRGTERHPDLQSISRALDLLYGSAVGTLVRKRGEVQTVGWYLDFLEDEYAQSPVFRPMLELLGEVLFSPRLEAGGYVPACFAGERLNLKNAIAAELNDKRLYATRQMLRTMCAGEAYRLSRNGTEAQLDALDPKGLYAHYQSLLESAPMEIFYLGAQPPEQVAEAVRELLAPLRRTNADPIPKTEFRAAPATVKEVEEALPLSQSKLSMGFRVEPWRDLPELADRIVFSMVYGGANGKLFRSVREEQSLCYYAGASYDRYKSILAVSSGVALEHILPARAEILRQLDRCQQGEIGERELDVAKKLLISAIRGDMDSPTRIDEYYLGQTVSGTDYTQLQLLDAVSRVSRDGVIRAAQSVRPDTFYCLRGTGG